MYMIDLIIIDVVVNIFSVKNHKSLRKLRVGVNRYMGMNWSTTTRLFVYGITIFVKVLPMTLFNKIDSPKCSRIFMHILPNVY